MKYSFADLSVIMIAEIALSLLLVWLTWSVVTTYKTRSKMPPGPFPYPFVGNFPQMLCDSADPFSKLAEKYGDIYTLSFPTGNTVVLNTASLVREARLGKKGGDFVGKSPESVYPFNEIFGDDFITIDYSPKFVFRRKAFISALHAFESSMKYGLSGDNALNILLEEIESKEKNPFCLGELIHASIVAQLWKMMTTKTVSVNDPVVNSITEFGEIVGRQALNGTIYQMIPFVSHLPSQFSRDIKRAVQIRETIIPPEFRAHLQSYQPDVIRDLTDSLISAFKKEIVKENGQDVGSLEDIPAIMMDIFQAGSGTTSSALTWFILYMVLHKKVQEKIQRELDIVVGKDRLPTLDDAKNMSYLQAALCEVLRIASVVPFIGTNAIRDTTIAGYHIPKGTLVAPNLMRVHHDEKEWPEPDVFKPERFLDSEEKFVGWTKLHGFMPFSAGRRECTGQSLARIMMITFASTLLHRYEIVLPDGAEKPTTKILAAAIILRPQDFKVVVKKRF
jgi:cytochrome P450